MHAGLGTSALAAQPLATEQLVAAAFKGRERAAKADGFGERLVRRALREQRLAPGEQRALRVSRCLENPGAKPSERLVQDSGRSTGSCDRLDQIWDRRDRDDRVDVGSLDGGDLK